MKTDWVIGRAKNWKEFQEALVPLSAKEKGDAFERLTQVYFKIDPVHSSKLKHVWLLSEVPTKTKEILNLKTKDQGIDLIAETKSGEYWAIQCKYREDNSKSLTLRELSTFATTAFTTCKNISYGLICTNADRITPKLGGAENIGFCTSEVWTRLDLKFFQNVRKLLLHKPIQLEPCKPRPHQKRAIKNSVKHFRKEKNSRGKLIMACGTGKSLIGYWITEALRARTALVAVPSLALMRQTLNVWLTEMAANVKRAEWICVCSDQTVGELDPDQPIVSTAELGIPCITEPALIASWLRKTKGKKQIIFTTYQSAKMLSQASKKSRTVYDIGILDEAHKTVGSKDKTFSHLLFEKNVKIRKRVFITATERRYIGDSDEIVSMDDPKIYGEAFETLSFKEALETQPAILCDYKIVTISVHQSEVNELIVNKAFVRPDKGDWKRFLTAHDFAALVALRKAMKKFKIKHAVSFHSSIERAKVFKENQDVLTSLVRSYDSLDTFHVSGAFPTSIRDQIVGEFIESNKALITNARCLTEGVDVPRIDCVLFADPKHSTIDIVQATGRALRFYETKEKGYIIIPLLIKDGSTIEEITESTEFKNVLTVLRALASNDDRIIEYFRSISQEKPSKGSRDKYSSLLEIVPTNIDTSDFIKAVELKCWNRLAKLSWRPFEEARNFARVLELKNQTEWFKTAKGLLAGKGNLPSDIPVKPNIIYSDSGWRTWGDWLGTKFVATQLREYLPFRKARQYVRILKLKGEEEWRKYKKGQLPEKGFLPLNIPGNPNQTYADRGWISWGDWFGSGRIAVVKRVFRPFLSARRFVRSLDLSSGKEWKLFCKGKLPKKGALPPDIPTNPWRSYRTQGWKGIGDWLGTGTIAPRLRKYQPFKIARAFVRRLDLKKREEWFQFCSGVILKEMNLPEDIPKNPWVTYKNKGWKGIADWLGLKLLVPKMRTKKSFRKARQFVRGMGLRNIADWRNAVKLGKLPYDIPTNSQKFYKNKGWIDWGDFLGTFRSSNKNKNFCSFHEGRIFARRLGLKTHIEWIRYCQGEMQGKHKIPSNIPHAPYHTYKNKGWVGWGDWLGTDNVQPGKRRFRSFKEAKKFVQGLMLRGVEEWKMFCKGKLPEKGKLSADIPSNPNRTYKNLGWQGYSDWLGKN